MPRKNPLLNVENNILINLEKINKNLEDISKKIKKEDNSFWLSIFALIIAFISLTVTAIPSSPKVFYYGNLNSDYHYCLPSLDEYGENLKVGFTNTGNKPTRLYLYIDGENIAIKDGTGYSGLEKFPYKNELTFITNILPYSVSQGMDKNYMVQIHNTSVKTASFEVGYIYDKDLFDIIPFYQVSQKQIINNCSYILNETKPYQKEWVLSS